MGPVAESRLEAYGRVVFVDEMGTNTSLFPGYASLPERTKGVVLRATQPRA
jgi:hypothetical protein